MKPLVTALAAMTVACPDPQRFAAFLTEVWDWERMAEGPIDSELETLWGVAPGSAGDHFIVLRSAGADRGMVRLVAGTDRARTKQRAARWGGFEIVVMNDIDGLYTAMVDHPVTAPFAPPKNFDFTAAESNIHRAFSAKLPGGTHVTLTMAVTQPKNRTFHTASARVGHIFEIPVTTPDYARCRGFYEKDLGLTPLLESQSADGPMHDAWGIPPGPTYHLDILKGDAPGAGLGAVEIHGIGAAYIDPAPVDPSHFDGGACMATFTTNDLDMVAAAVHKSAHARVIAEPRAIAAPPYVGARAFSFFGPDGERVDVCETMWA
jgi:catechol 2,3-dioxygenase-like lactoylglutathione lyase family enzyme